MYWGLLPTLAHSAPGPSKIPMGFSAVTAGAVVSLGPCSTGSSFSGLSAWKQFTEVPPFTGLLCMKILIPDLERLMFQRFARDRAVFFLNFCLVANTLLFWLHGLCLPQVFWGQVRFLWVDLEICFWALLGKVCWYGPGYLPSACHCGTGWSHGCIPHSSPGAAPVPTCHPHSHGLSNAPDTLFFIYCFSFCRQFFPPDWKPWGRFSRVYSFSRGIQTSTTQIQLFTRHHSYFPPLESNN